MDELERELAASFATRAAAADDATGAPAEEIVASARRRRRAKGLGVAGAALAVFALIVGLVVVPSPGSRTTEVLTDVGETTTTLPATTTTTTPGTTTTATPTRTPAGAPTTTMAIPASNPCDYEEPPRLTGASRSPSGRVWIAVAGGSVATSDDDGDSWTWHCYVMSAAGMDSWGARIFATGNLTAWAVGNSTRYVQVLAATVDAGRTWKRVELDSPGVTTQYLDGIDVIDPSTAVAWTWNYRHAESESYVPAVYRTTDGSTWSEVESDAPLPGKIRRMSFADRSHGWALALENLDQGQPSLYATDDGGLTWRPIARPERLSTPTDVALATPSYGCLTSQGMVACSMDGGSTWTYDHVGPRYVHRVVALDDRRMLVGGGSFSGEAQSGTVAMVEAGRVTHRTAADAVVTDLSADWGTYASFWQGSTLYTESDAGLPEFESHDITGR